MQRKAQPIDFEILRLLAALAENAPPPEASLQEVREAQRLAASHMPPGPDLFRVEDVDVGEAMQPVAARLYFGSADVDALIVFFHGGGWMLGSIEVSDAAMRRIAAGTGAIVLSVDYRLAPEHPFPAAFEDAQQAVRWAAQNAARLTGRETPRIAVAGESAGANLAAAVALLARLEGPRIDAQILSCPVLSADLDTQFIRETPSPFPPKETLPALFQNYARQPQDMQDSRFAPLLADSVDGVPPALIFTVELDSFREQAEIYADRLRAAGVPCVLKQFEGTIHGFLELDGGHRQSREAIVTIASHLRKLSAGVGQNTHENGDRP